MKSIYENSTTSLWHRDSALHFSSLNHALTTDVIVIGAGISGLTTAYMLCREGIRVIVIDDGPVGYGETLRTTAHLSYALDDRYYNLIDYHGEEGAKRAAESHKAAIQTIEDIVRRENIKCDFIRLNGYLFLGPEDDREELIKELNAAHRAGLSEVELLDHTNFKGLELGPALCFPYQAQFDPAKYIRGLVTAISANGGKIFSNTHASRIEGEPTPRVVTSHGTEIFAESIVVATNSPVNTRVSLHTKQAAYRSYVLAFKIKRDSVPTALFWDTQDPYHYVRIQSDPECDYDILIVGGEDHKTGQETHYERHYERLEKWARDKFLGIGEVIYRWSGQILETLDGLAYIGQSPDHAKNVYIISGDSGHGMTHGTLGGYIVSDLIMKRENPWVDLYDPNRIPLRAASEFISENANVAAQYMDWVTGGDVTNREDIPYGEGAVIRDGLSKIAIYRALDGTFHDKSAVCPHLGGIVHWNSGEKTWDCPCHGSRFDCHGRVINGPANSDLLDVEEEDTSEWKVARVNDDKIRKDIPDSPLPDLDLGLSRI